MGSSSITKDACHRSNLAVMMFHLTTGLQRQQIVETLVQLSREKLGDMGTLMIVGDNFELRFNDGKVIRQLMTNDSEQIVRDAIDSARREQNGEE